MADIDAVVPVPGLYTHLHNFNLCYVHRSEYCCMQFKNMHVYTPVPISLEFHSLHQQWLSVLAYSLNMGSCSVTLKDMCMAN